MNNDHNDYTDLFPRLLTSITAPEPVLFGFKQRTRVAAARKEGSRRAEPIRVIVVIVLIRVRSCRTHLTRTLSTY